MISYKKTGLISCIIALIGVLGIILQPLVPNLAFMFNFLFYLGILGITISFFLYALHLYEFNSPIISNVTLSCIILLYMMSLNIINFSTIVPLLLSGIQGWFVICTLFSPDICRILDPSFH